MTDRRIITVPVTMQAPVRKADDSVKLGFVTNHEVTNEDFALMDTYRKTSGWLIYAENQLGEEAVPLEDAPGEQRKSKIQRLRGVYWLIWSRRTDQSEPFEAWWDRKFEQLLDKAKELIE